VGERIVSATLVQQRRRTARTKPKGTYKRPKVVLVTSKHKGEVVFYDLGTKEATVVTDAARPLAPPYTRPMHDRESRKVRAWVRAVKTQARPRPARGK
jgi:hypothetical protein